MHLRSVFLLTGGIVCAGIVVVLANPLRATPIEPDIGGAFVSEHPRNACLPRPGGSRWAAAPGEYVRTALYGQEPNGWLASVAGLVVAPDGDVIVYDAASARVVVLSEALEPRKEFGRRGEGPGEFSGLSVPAAAASEFSLLDATDSLIFVHDGKAVEVFNRDGTPHDHVSGLIGGIAPPFTLRAIRAEGPDLLYAYDSVAVQGHVQRRLQTWAVTGDARTLVLELPLKNPPMPGGMVYAHPREARPLWGIHGRCVLMGDGSSERILVYDRETARVDTLSLPPHEVPAPAIDRRRARAHSQVRDFAASRGIPFPDLEGVEPAAVWRWSELVVDPDGYAWIRPWSPPNQDENDQEILRIDIRSGHVEEQRVPAFPRAFGAPGVFYAIEKDPNTDEVLVTRYSRQGQQH